MKRYRVGITLKGLVCSKYIHDTIQALKSENNIEIILILDEITDQKIRAVIKNISRIAEEWRIKFNKLFDILVAANNRRQTHLLFK